jgi:hypothetical protein
MKQGISGRFPPSSLLSFMKVLLLSLFQSVLSLRTRALAALTAYALSFLLIGPAYATTYYYVGGTNDHWEKASNWSTLPRGPGNGAVPTSKDIAVLSYSGTTVRIRSHVTASGILLSNLWTGSLLLGTGTVTIVGTPSKGGGLRVGSGYLTGGSSSSGITIASTGTGYTQTGGVVTLTGPLSLTGSFSHRAGTFTMTSANSMLRMNGSSQNLNLNGVNVYQLYIAAGTTTLTSNAGVTSTITIDAGATLALSSHIFSATGATILNSGTIALNTGTLVHYATAVFLGKSDYTTTDGMKAGDTLYLSVNDSDANLDGTAVDTLSVTVTTSGGDSETVTLSETGVATGVFHGSIATANAAVATSDGTIQVPGDTTVTMTYTDSNDGYGGATSTIVSAIGNSSTSSGGGGGGGRGSGGGGGGGGSKKAVVTPAVPAVPNKKGTPATPAVPATVTKPSTARQAAQARAKAMRAKALARAAARKAAHH